MPSALLCPGKSEKVVVWGYQSWWHRVTPGHRWQWYTRGQGGTLWKKNSWNPALCRRRKSYSKKPWIMWAWRSHHCSQKSRNRGIPGRKYRKDWLIWIPAEALNCLDNLKLGCIMSNWIASIFSDTGKRSFILLGFSWLEGCLLKGSHFFFFFPTDVFHLLF